MAAVVPRLARLSPPGRNVSRQPSAALPAVSDGECALIHASDSRVVVSGGTNAQKSGLGQQARKLADATGEDGFRHEKVSLDLKLRIMKARQAKGMTQKELAQKIGEKPQVVNQMEAGKTVPNNQILGKMERALGVKLRGAPGPLGGA